jgi:hypothetical protein
MAFSDEEILGELVEAQGRGRGEYFTAVRVFEVIGRDERQPKKPMPAAYFREWRRRNPEQARAIARAYKARHPERVKALAAARWARYAAKKKAAKCNASKEAP